MWIWMLVALGFAQSTRIERNDLQWACDDALPEPCLTLAEAYRTGTKAVKKDHAMADRLARRACVIGMRKACDRRAQWHAEAVSTTGELGRWILADRYLASCALGNEGSCARGYELIGELAYEGPPILVATPTNEWARQAGDLLGRALMPFWNRCVGKDRAWQTRIIVTLTVAPSGQVQDVTFAEHSTKNRVLEGCIATAMLGLQFPAQTEGTDPRHARANLDFGREGPSLHVDTPDLAPDTPPVPRGGVIPASVAADDQPLGACRHGSVEACEVLTEAVSEAWWTFDLNRRSAWVLLNLACEQGATEACPLRDAATVREQVPRTVEPFIELPKKIGGDFARPMRCRARIAANTKGRPTRVDVFSCGGPQAAAIRKGCKRARWFPQQVDGVPVGFRTTISISAAY